MDYVLLQNNSYTSYVYTFYKLVSLGDIMCVDDLSLEFNIVLIIT